MYTSRSKERFHHSHVLHFFVIFLVSTAVLTTTLTLYTFQHFKLKQEELRNTETLRLDLATKSVTRNLKQSIIDVRLLAGSQHMQEYLNNPDPRNTSRLQKDFIHISRETAIFDQIRYIDRNGQERIRVNYNNGNPGIVPPEQLQDKSNRYYFRESIRLPVGHVYLSPMDLNIENGKIELPFKPMIRIATPLSDPHSDTTAGVLVLNYLADSILSQFKEAMSHSWGKAMMLNHEAYWLYSSRPQDEWGFMFGNHDNFANRYPQTWMTLLKSDSGNVQNSKGLFIYNSVRPLKLAGFQGQDAHRSTLVWRLVSWVKPEQLTFSIWRTIRENKIVTNLLVVLTALMSYLLAWLRTNNLIKTDALETSRARYQSLFDNMAEGYALLEAQFDSKGRAHDFRYLAINPAFEHILGLKRDEVVGKTIKSLIPDIEDYWLEAYARVATAGQAAHLEQYNSRFGRYFEITAASPDYGLVAVFFADVTERKRAEEQQRQAATAFNNTMEAIMITDADQKIMVVNQAYTRITGYSSEEAIGMVPSLHRSGRHDEEFYQQLWRSLEQSGHWQGEIWNRRKDGEVFPAWENISVVKDEQGQIRNYVTVFSDISTIKQTEARLSELAHHDSLTGLANRLAFNQNLEKALERAKRHQYKVALLFLDLDRFKLINDTLGHAAGDKMLQITGRGGETGR